MRGSVAVLGAVLLAGLAGAEQVELPTGRISAVIVAADGETHVVLNRQTRNHGHDAILVRLDGSTVRTIEEFGGPSRLVPLTEGRFLLHEYRLATIVKLRRDGFERFAAWNLEDYPEWDYTVPPPIVFSGDGRIRGVGWSANFSIGRMQSSGSAPASHTRYTADLGGHPVVHKWRDYGSQDSIFLDSEGPVVLEPWHRGAYIVHYSDAGSPYVVPILFHDGVEEWEYVWQWEERVLWASTSRYWKAYHLWDLGLTPPSEPFWVSDSASARPHAERGIVEVHRTRGGYQVEHVRVDPWSAQAERHVSDWSGGAVLGVPEFRVRGAYRGDWSAATRVFVSANGRHGVVIGRRHLEGDGGAFVNVARRFRLDPAPPRDAVEVDPAWEKSGDREAMGSDVLQRIAEQVDSSDQQE